MFRSLSKHIDQLTNITNAIIFAFSSLFIVKIIKLEILFSYCCPTTHSIRSITSHFCYLRFLFTFKGANGFSSMSSIPQILILLVMYITKSNFTHKENHSVSFKGLITIFLMNQCLYACRDESIVSNENIQKCFNTNPHYKSYKIHLLTQLNPTRHAITALN